MGRGRRTRRHKPLEPFKDGKELIDKSIAVFKELRPYFGECLEVMQDMKRLDLDSRKNKAPADITVHWRKQACPSSS